MTRRHQGGRRTRSTTPIAVIDLVITGLSFAAANPCIPARFGNARREQVALAGSHLLVAARRRPNTDDQGLEATGLPTDPRGIIPLDNVCRSAQPHTWVLSQEYGRKAFTHGAHDDFEIVAGNLLNSESRRISDRKPSYALFIDPPLGRIGISKNEARAARHRILLGTRAMARAWARAEIKMVPVAGHALSEPGILAELVRITDGLRGQAKGLGI